MCPQKLSTNEGASTGSARLQPASDNDTTAFTSSISIFKSDFFYYFTQAEALRSQCMRPCSLLAFSFCVLQILSTREGICPCALLAFLFCVLYILPPVGASTNLHPPRNRQKSIHKKKTTRKIWPLHRKQLTLHPVRQSLPRDPLTQRKGHSPAGLERCSHIAEVPGSNPGVPTSVRHLKEYGRFFIALHHAPHPNPPPAG